MNEVKLENCSLRAYKLNNGVIMLTVQGWSGNFTEIKIDQESLERLKMLSRTQLRDPLKPRGD